MDPDDLPPDTGAAYERADAITDAAKAKGLTAFAFDQDWLDVWHLPARAVMDGTSNVSRCRSCNAEILWVTSSKSGKKAPLDRDGASHFGSCPSAESWRKK